LYKGGYSIDSAPAEKVRGAEYVSDGEERRSRLFQEFCLRRGENIKSTLQRRKFREWGVCAKVVWI